MMRVGGVDGCRAGWLCVARDPVSGAASAQVYGTVAELVAGTRDLAVVAIDVPIGLADVEPRQCDIEARRLLGPARASSVFPTPVRAALDAATYEEACARSAAACGRRLSRQTFNILDRIRDVDRALRAAPELQRRFHEAHPEVCFHVWHGGPLGHGKRTAEGRTERRALVAAAFGPLFETVRGAWPRGAVADDDILDAGATLWTAERVVRGEAWTMPAAPPRDRHGLPMRMVV
jgi:predicted RNase H-like nuclease